LIDNRFPTTDEVAIGNDRLLELPRVSIAANGDTAADNSLDLPNISPTIGRMFISRSRRDWQHPNDPTKSSILWVIHDPFSSALRTLHDLFS
jgi:hypothetical protein